MRHISLITTGGTIEKIYDEQTGSLENRQSIVRQMLARLRLEEIEIKIVELMSKDSLDLDDADRERIVEVVRAESEAPTTGVVILHGTDTLETTGEALHAGLSEPRVPIVLTGAMRPFEMIRTDALQNLTEAIFATGVLKAGVYCVAHGRALRFPGVVKDRGRVTFVRSKA
ncbi:L-asparaginase [hydrothermal vent metagenome]|uniref:L-asparaginase n=1 Tax=hydrothermal vent metagenome TaxID=652676 RepID=A0A3B1DJI8_9ZZZZ